MPRTIPERQVEIVFNSNLPSLTCQQIVFKFRGAIALYDAPNNTYVIRVRTNDIIGLMRGIGFTPGVRFVREIKESQ